MSTCYLPSDVFLADLTDNFGVQRFPASPLRSVSVATTPCLKRWGQRIQQAGLAGIVYPAAHDLALEQRSIALFGNRASTRPRSRPWPVLSPMTCSTA